VVQKKECSDDDIVSFLDCVYENISEVESSDSDNDIGNKNMIAEVAHQTVNKVTCKWLSCQWMT
jgi:hypothetical protein